MRSSIKPLSLWLGLALSAIAPCQVTTAVTPDWTRTATATDGTSLDSNGTRTLSVNGSLVTVYDRTTQRNVATYVCTYGIQDADFAPDGASFAVANANGEIEFINSATGAVNSVLSMGARGNASQVLYFQRGASTQMLTFHAGTIQLWTLTSGTWNATFAWNSVTSNRAAVRADGAQFAITTGANVYVYRVSSPTASPQYTLTPGTTCDWLEYSPSNLRLAIESDAEGIRLYQTTDYASVGTITTGDSVNKFGWTSDSQGLWTVFNSYGQRIGLYSVAGQLLRSSARFSQWLYDVNVSSDDRFTSQFATFTGGLVATTDGYLGYGPLMRGKLSILAPMDATRVLAGTNMGFLYAVDPATGDVTRTVDLDTWDVYALATNASAKRIAVVTPDTTSNGTIRLYDYNFNQVGSVPLYDAGNSYDRIAFNPTAVGGVRQFAYTDGNVIQILNATTMQIIRTLFRPTFARCVAFSLDGTRMAVGDDGAFVKFYRTDDFTEVGSVTLTAAPYHLGFGSSTNRLMAFPQDYSGSAVVLTRTAVGDTWTVGTPVDLPNFGVAAKVGFSPDGNTAFASDDASGHTLLIDTANCAVVRDFTGGGYLPFQSQVITPLCYSGDGLRLMQGLRNNEVFGSHVNPVPVFVSTTEFSVNPVNRGSNTVLTVRFSRPAVAGTQVSISYPSTRLTGPTTLTPAPGTRVATAVIAVAANTPVGQYPITITLGRQVKPKLTVQ